MPALDPEHARNLASSLLEEVEELRKIMTRVATGEVRIPDIDDEYGQRRKDLSQSLKRLGLEDPNPFKGLWDWYERWSSGDLPTYRSRRQFLRELFSDLQDELERIAGGEAAPPVREPTGWPAVDRVVGKMRMTLSEAKDAEDFQAVGLLGREVLISLAQAVYRPHRHPTVDGVTPSATDAKRMLDSVIAIELHGSSNEATRKHAKAALDLAVSLQHSRTADFRVAALCVEATASVVNITSIVCGRHNPEDVA